MPSSEAGQGTVLGGGSREKLRMLASCLWRALESEGKLPATGSCGLQRWPLQGSVSGREGSVPKGMISHQWTGGLHMFCGHFHMEPAQIPLGAVRVDIKPSEPSGRLALCLWALSAWAWQSLLEFRAPGLGAGPPDAVRNSSLPLLPHSEVGPRGSSWGRGREGRGW